MDIVFLQNCKAQNVIPKFLRFKLYKRCLHNSTLYLVVSWQHKLLVNELKSKRRTLEHLKLKIVQLLQEVNNTFSNFDCVYLHRVLDDSVTRFTNKTRSTHSKKLKHLGIDTNLDPVDSVIFNYSSITLSPRIKILLSFGLDFGLPVFKLDFFKYFLCFERLVNCSKKFQCTNFTEFTECIRNISVKYFHNFKPYKVFSAIIDKSDISLLKQFALNKNIIVSRPDKGRGVVIINKCDYISSMLKIISDTTKFKVINDNINVYSLKIEDQVNRFLLKLKKLNLISDDNYNKLHVSGSGPGVLYGLPKIHKVDFASKFQFRPIFTAYNSACYKISKFLVDVLNPLTTNAYTCSNSYNFSKDIQNYSSPNCFMASFDIENLFTNIPLHETIQIILNQLFSNPTSTVLGLSRDLFRKFLELSVLNCYFLFNDVLYKQVEGLGMGLPLGPTFANIFMSYHESIWLNQCPANFKPIFYRRYIDDTFVIFKDRDHVSMFLDYLNSRHINIKFTCELENDGRLPFLDCLVHRNNSKFDVSVYRKPTFSGLGSSFYSFCPFNFKLNSINTLLFRAYNICSTYLYLHEEFKFLVNFFRSNGYCSKFVEKQISKFFFEATISCKY